MIGIVVVTHSSLAMELRQAAEMILGPVTAVASISIDRGTSMELARDRLREALAEVDGDRDGVLILTDLFGGTPTNLSVEFLQPGRVEILSGVNLPMVIKAFSERSHRNLTDLTQFLKEYARSAIVRPADLL